MQGTTLVRGRNTRGCAAARTSTRARFSLCLSHGPRPHRDTRQDENKREEKTGTGAESDDEEETVRKSAQELAQDRTQWRTLVLMAVLCAAECQLVIRPATESNEEYAFVYPSHGEWLVMWRETELITQQNALLCDCTVLFISQRHQRPHRLDDQPLAFA
jgi:hypothetical protein